MENAPRFGSALCICHDMYSPEEKGSLEANRLVLWSAKMWAPGDKLTTSFIGGTSQQRTHVIDAAKRIMEVANIDFVFVDSRGVIRIAFNPSLGAWSMVGRDALTVSMSQPTMNLGFDQAGTYTHELVHALGAIHEHQSRRRRRPGQRRHRAGDASDTDADADRD